jgi:FG-GAP repeat protein
VKGQFPATLSLRNLTAPYGFKLYGESMYDQSGFSVSAAGDINGDGYGDLAIGSPQCFGSFCSGPGRGYVVFGGLDVGKNEDIVIILSELNGRNGFKMNGESGSDECGFSVSSAGDINTDGYADLVIGAPSYWANEDSGKYTGRSYVVFGGPNVGGSGTIALSSLNGANGFKLDGEEAWGHSGWSVSGAGDVNGDGHDDLIIGAPGYNSYTGRSYVVFGGSGIGSSGLLELSSLNGTNGFKLDGEPSNNQDLSGQSVNTAGDINGDGYDDLVIGAPGHGGGRGSSYLVFGGPGVGNSGDITLSNLNGSNGFRLDGELNDYQSGLSVSAAGDINDDGYADLVIGAPNLYTTYSPSSSGRSYVVFGGSTVGSSGVILLVNLDGNNGFKVDGEVPATGYSVSTAGDINGDGIADLLIGAPACIYGYGQEYCVTASSSYVVFGIKNSKSVPSSTSTLFELALMSGIAGGLIAAGIGLACYLRYKRNKHQNEISKPLLTASAQVINSETSEHPVVIKPSAEQPSAKVLSDSMAQVFSSPKTQAESICSRCIIQ